MMRWFLIVVMSLLVLVLAAVLLGPLLISPRSLGGAAAPSELATPRSQFLSLPSPGLAALDIHYLTSPPAAETLPAAPMPFLLLHGFTFNAWTWEPSLDFFGARGPTFAYDQIPYGLSAKPIAGDWQGANPYSKRAAIDQVFAVMDQLGLAQAVLVGNSSGGTLALEAALERPERVRALVLVAPWVYVSRPTLPEPLASLPQMRRISLLIARKLGADAPLLDLSYADPERIDAHRRERFLLHTGVSNWDLAWGELFQLSLSTPVRISEHLDRIAVPTLVIGGEIDRLVPLDDSRQVAARLPDAEFAVLPGCGHVPQEECPEDFQREVDRWLRAQGLISPASAPAWESGRD